ncbi:SigE family RNA polymerase sigma factor [Sinosporangium siamense]|uniref:DNA-directed RNA polymerase sigma-70 factor n=1 Tax=Sinosporangium siamense TaxID=1367973 RepID=A0A919V4Q5_9ACTN|nr:SigE family RNA polymerase sigma factor [Sinosporangium siamense]GII90753.1 DNA-directed RNA polymerase sigma-70 factor [Sinosporangium siamense]
MTRGDLGGFEEFLEKRLPALYRFALVLTDSPHDAEELVQEALTRTGAAWWRVRRKDDPEGYVRAAMVRIATNRWRRPRRELPVAEVPDRAGTDHGVERVVQDAGVASLLAGLPYRMRAVLALRYVDQLSDAQIAGVLGCTVGTVRSQASRALAKLRAVGQEDTDGRAAAADRGISAGEGHGS